MNLRKSFTRTLANKLISRLAPPPLVFFTNGRCRFTSNQLYPALVGEEHQQGRQAINVGLIPQLS